MYVQWRHSQFSLLLNPRRFIIDKFSNLFELVIRFLLYKNDQLQLWDDKLPKTKKLNGFDLLFKGIFGKSFLKVSAYIIAVSQYGDFHCLIIHCMENYERIMTSVWWWTVTSQIFISIAAFLRKEILGITLFTE